MQYKMNFRIRKKNNLINILLFLIGVSTPIGAGLSELLKVDVSKLFLLLVLILGFTTVVVIRNIKLNIFPKTYIAYIAFIILHTILFCFVLFPNELFTINTQEELTLIGIIRFVFMIIYSVLLVINISNKHQLFKILVGYVWGYIISFAVGIYFLFDFIGTDNFRLSAGFQNPNSFGLSSVIFLFIVLFLIINKKIVGIRNVLFIFIGLLGLVLSESRSAILGPILGIAYITFKNINKKGVIVKTIVGALLVIILFFVFVPKEFKESLGERFSLSERIESGRESRIFIWNDYLSNIHKYILQGYGRGRVTKITEDNYSSSTNYATHNKYLNVFAEFGIIGLSLFILMLFYISRGLLNSRLNLNEIYLTRIFFSSWIILMLFGDFTNSRELWMSISIMIVLGNLKYNLSDEENINS
jgi:O-antigen ligase